MLSIKLRLIGEEEEQPPEGIEATIKIDREIDYESLKNEIEKTIFIPSSHQEITFQGGAKLEHIRSPLSNCQFGQVLQIKHTSLGRWLELKKTVQKFVQLQESDEKKLQFQIAQDLIQTLMTSKFFVSYYFLNDKFHKIHRTLYRRYDKKDEEIQTTVKSYFEKLFADKNPIFTFSKKTEGTRAGTICTIQCQGTTEKYYCKTNHDGGHRNSPSRSEIDLRELFIYKLLESVECGAKVRFATSSIGSKSVIYICSMEVPGFETFKEKEEKETNLSNYTKPAVHILTLFTVLNLSDCHSENVGTDEHNSPFVIDFFLGPLGIRDLERDFLSRIRASNNINQKVDELAFETKLKIAVDFLMKIELKKKIDDVHQNFKEGDKKIFEENDIHFSKSKTDDLDEYVEHVKKNADKFFNYSRTTSS